MTEWFCITLLMLEMLKQSLNFISAFFACKYSAGKFSKSISVKTSNFSVLDVIVLFSNLNARVIGAYFIFFHSYAIFLHFKSNTLMKF